MTLPLIQTVRDLREFLEAKKRKREPIRLRARAGTAASYVPTSHRGFQRFRGALALVPDWGRASEQLDALELALQRRNGVVLPLPRRVLQNEDRSLTLFWEGITVRCFGDAFMSLIGGTSGVPATKISNELLDALGFQARIQRAS